MKRPLILWLIFGLVGWGLWINRVYQSSQLAEITWDIVDDAMELATLGEEYKEAYEDCIQELGR